ncbi:MAG: FtsH protease activity modulator HflK [Thermoguttaceae bacterium]|jgi:membrane protease subunit HflK|nr:FtsH protease activity modulator HflK [Thermoguttaceae bacterium]
MEFNINRPRGHGSHSPEVPWDRILTTVPTVLIVLIVLYLVWASVYTVEPHEKAVVLRFGQHHATVDPGLRFCIPVVDEVIKVSVEEHSVRLPIEDAGTRPNRVPEDETLMLTGDLDAVLVEWTVQWQVTDPYRYSVKFFRAGDPDYPERVLVTVAQNVMNRLVGDYSIDEVLTERRGEIGEAARQATQEILDIYACGIGIRDLQMQRTTPPGKVQPSYEQVNASEQLRAQLKNEADKERNKLLPEAEAEKDKTINEALGYAKRRWSEADGEIKALLEKYRAYEKAPDVTRQRLYIEAMEEVLGQVESKVILDADLPDKILPLLPLGQGAGQ